MKITRAVVPSLFTILNIFCGFLSLLSTARGEYDMAAWLIVSAGIFDVLDGMMARITKSFSDFGVELDSLCDVVSFGVAPSFLVYTIFLHTMNGTGTLISAMPMAFGAMRLARFNSQLVSYDKEYFKGLPIPATAMMICAFVLRYYTPEIGINSDVVWLLAPMVVILSLLMVSNIKYDALPKLSKRGLLQHPLRFTVMVVGVTAIILTQGSALFPFFVFYVATGPLRLIVETIKRVLRPFSKNREEDSELTSVDV
ncbi:MAG: CDP-diacylglycerol--serine O-phosphatidyltransferase [Bacteroidota bacterium]